VRRVVAANAQGHGRAHRRHSLGGADVMGAERITDISSAYVRILFVIEFGWPEI